MDIDHLKISLRKDNFPVNFIDSSIKSFLNNFFTPKVIVHDIPKRDVFIKLSFSGSTLFQICKKLQKSLTEELTCCNLKNLFRAPTKFRSFLTFKDKLPKILRSGFVYKYKSGWLQCCLLWQNGTSL